LGEDVALQARGQAQALQAVVERVERLPGDVPYLILSLPHPRLDIARDHIAALVSCAAGDFVAGFGVGFACGNQLVVEALEAVGAQAMAA
jgi:hypothetical protein